MKKEVKEIKFENRNSTKSHVDLVLLEDLLQRKPSDHNQYDFHKLSFFVILLHTQNEGVYNVNFIDYDFKKGSLFTLRKDNVHKFYPCEAKGMLLIFTENFILNNASQSQVSKTFLLFNEMLASPKLQLNAIEYAEITTLFGLIKDEYFGMKDDYSLDIIRSYIQVLVAKLFRIKSKDNLVLGDQMYLSKYLRFQALVERHCFMQKKVTYYAKEMGVTTKTLNNITQSILQKTAKAFINEIVISQSKRLIINSQDSLTEIAYQTGFKEPTNFFKYFRKYTGFSPSEFRASCQAGS